MSGITFIKYKDQLLSNINHQSLIFKKIILKKGIVPNLLQFATVNFQSGDSIEKHSHESMYEIFYVIKGELIVFNDLNQTKVSDGDAFVVYPKQNHRFEILQNAKLIYFNIESDN